LFTSDVDTREKSIAGINDILAITENMWQGLFAGVVDTGDKFIAGVIDTGEQLIAGVVDTGDKHSLAIISANFRKNLKRPQWNTWGPRGQWFMKKHEVKNLVFNPFLMGLGSSDGLIYFLYVWIDVGIIKRCGKFLNFLVAFLYKVH
jgi:hypothetical protein